MRKAICWISTNPLWALQSVCFHCIKVKCNLSCYLSVWFRFSLPFVLSFRFSIQAGFLRLNKDTAQTLNQLHPCNSLVQHSCWNHCFVHLLLLTWMYKPSFSLWPWDGFWFDYMSSFHSLTFSLKSSIWSHELSLQSPDSESQLTISYKSIGIAWAHRCTWQKSMGPDCKMYMLEMR